MIYLASPYSDPLYSVRLDRFCKVCVAAAYLMENGFRIFSPIAHSHPIATNGIGLPTDWAYWEPYCREMLGMCEAMIVLQLPGWAMSRGVSHEIMIAQELKKPVTFLLPAEAPYFVPTKK